MVPKSLIENAGLSRNDLINFECWFADNIFDVHLLGISRAYWVPTVAGQCSWPLQYMRWVLLLIPILQMRTLGPRPGVQPDGWAWSTLSFLVSSSLVAVRTILQNLQGLVAKIPNFKGFFFFFFLLKGRTEDHCCHGAQTCTGLKRKEYGISGRPNPSIGLSFLFAVRG